jgi:DNA-binding MarR family transcriptional regulator
MSLVINKQGTSYRALQPLGMAIAELGLIHPDITLMQLKVFTAISVCGTTTTSELAEILGTEVANLYFSIDMLADGKTYNSDGDGLDLIQRNTDPDCIRRNLITLTEKGNLTAKLVSVRLNGATDQYLKAAIAV